MFLGRERPKDGSVRLIVKGDRVANWVVDPRDHRGTQSQELFGLSVRWYITNVRYVVKSLYRILKGSYVQRNVVKRIKGGLAQLSIKITGNLFNMNAKNVKENISLNIMGVTSIVLKYVVKDILKESSRLENEQEKERQLENLSNL